MPNSLRAVPAGSAPGTVIDNLNSLLRSEISAVETYGQAFTHLQAFPCGDLIANRECHRQRVALIASIIRQLGGTPETSAGMWSALARVVEHGPAPISERAIIAALEEGEKQAVVQYRQHGELDASSSQLIRTVLLSRQNRSRERLRLCIPMG